MEHQSVERPISVPAGFLCALVATLFWSGNFVVARGLHAQISPVGLAFWRWSVAAVALMPFALRPLIRDWSLVREHLGYLCGSALIGVTLFNTLIYLAGRTTNAINMAAIVAAFPVFVILLARLFLGEPITVAKAVGTLVAVAGVLLLITDGSLSRLLSLTFSVGDLWVVGAALAFAGYSILVKRKPSSMRTESFLLSTFVLGVLFLVPFYVIGLLTDEPVGPSRTTVLAVLYVGIFPSVVSFFLWNRAIAVLGPSQAGLVYYLTPVWSGLLAALFLGEAFVLVHVASLVLIVSGIVVAERGVVVKRVYERG